MIGVEGRAAAIHRGARLALGLCALLVLAACERDQALPGERFGTRVPLAATLPGADGRAAASDLADTDAPRAISLPAPTRLGDWPSRGYNTVNRLPHATLSAAPAPLWVADIGTGNSRRNRIATDPVAGNGLVFTIDAGGQLQATSLSTGAPAWIASLVPDFDRGGNASGGGLALSGDRLYATSPYGELLALNASTGAVIWRQRLGTVLGAPTVSGGLVYVVGRNSEAWAVEADDGRLRWTIPSSDAPSVLVGGAAPAVADGRVIFPFPSGEIVAALPNTGITLWNSFVAGGRLGTAYANMNDITSDPVVVGGTIYAGNQSGRVVAMDGRTGTRQWTAAEGAYSPVLVAGGAVFFVSDRNELIRLDADTGARVWGTELPLYVANRERRRKAVFTHYGPILAGGRLIVASGDGLVRMFSPESGELVGTLELRGGAASHPIAVGDMLLVVGQDGRLHAFR
ncbi:PQQ-like beta-propeller repeat protein [Roseicyclus persicicus]|uniref:PQQ-binding-like beta-propeller repeat protein n=1 Tax=Roseicyclus persicicus TaxID=2650661 RepID=A0A7X6K100_9RHOB|nr:PQQ-like beta-propeller repeat protein [Roseibacterium persicicum]NKX46408.1 PQQ-binding-like beta-propeller repeat protein [Roseibacterium persicicum]